MHQPVGTAAAANELAALRRRIAAIESRRTKPERPPISKLGRHWNLGINVLDNALPDSGLAPDGLHEAAGETDMDGPTAGAFLAALLARYLRTRRGDGTVLVCQSDVGASRFGHLYGSGWRDPGLEPGELLILRSRRERDVCWAMEQGLRSGALTAVLGEVEGLDFTASRRLALAAREGVTPGLLLRYDGLGRTSAAMTRWQVTPLPGRGDPLDEAAPGPARWHLALMRCRGGRPANCDVEWIRETGDFRVVATLADRPAAPRTTAATDTCRLHPAAG